MAVPIPHGRELYKFHNLILNHDYKLSILFIALGFGGIGYGGGFRGGFIGRGFGFGGGFYRPFFRPLLPVPIPVPVGYGGYFRFILCYIQFHFKMQFTYFFQLIITNDVNLDASIFVYNLYRHLMAKQYSFNILNK